MTRKVSIKGMSCAHCKERVEKELKRLSSVSKVSIDLSNNRATVEGTMTDTQIKDAIKSAGYEVSSIK